MSDEFLPRQAGWQTNRLPDHVRTVLVRTSDVKMPVWLAYYDGKRWRSLNRGSIYGVIGWCELEDCAAILDAAKNPK